MTRVIANQFVVEKGAVYLMVDMDHPELHWFTDDIDHADGTVVLCHPSQEAAVRDVLAKLGERFELNELLTALRRRDPHAWQKAKL